MTGKANSGARAIIEERLKRVAEVVDRELSPHPPVERTPGGQHRHMLEEAQELYSNELHWEEESGEETTESGSLAELVFPGTLALIDALVTEHTPGAEGEGRPHRDVVFAFMEWIADRIYRLRSGVAGGSATRRAKEIDLADRLLDLVLYRYCGLTAEEIEGVDSAGDSDGR